ncbi:ABC transporter ATP-binding protein [Natronoglycomyces albus]|uniref:ABC transporter ATP-binding protein n=1 Tax=Natronoglycomyces albus TaxID=2811108 RepID=A0A895XM03_9ACTN|nr:ABC transporter ATP-binding protein [Natronoglycomyces albus]QSB06711.1 ABC transporter ATP-binding protein [Natronoglycomyces albus]
MTDQRAHPPAVSSAPAFAVQNVTCQYGSYTAVEEVSFSVSSGEIFALLGTNGAGKTTTVESLQGNHTPTSGQVRVLGKDPGRLWRTLAGRVAVISQESGFAPDLTVAETLRMWQALNPRREATAFAGQDPIDVVGLSHRRDAKVGVLSGGEKRRLDLALAVSTGPEVLFADEPTTGLDPASRRSTWEVLRTLAAHGCAILLTTHYLDEAAELADQVAIMNSGKVVQSGTVAQVVSAQDATISFALPEGVTASHLPELVHGRTDCFETGGRRSVVVYTGQLQADMLRILTWADEEGLVLEELAAHPASLDEVFAALSDQDA